MPFEFKKLASDLERAGDVSSEEAREIVRMYFAENNADGNSLRSVLAQRIFTELASDYVLVKRTDLSGKNMQIKNRVSGQALSSLRRKQRFVVEAEPAVPVHGESVAANSVVALPREHGSSPNQLDASGHGKASPFMGLNTSRQESDTSKEMRRFTKLARGGHLIAKGGVFAENQEPNYYSSVYDTAPARCWTPLGESTKRPSIGAIRSATPLPELKDTALREEKPSRHRPPVKSFAEYVKSRQ